MEYMTFFLTTFRYVFLIILLLWLLGKEAVFLFCAVRCREKLVGRIDELDVYVSETHRGTGSVSPFIFYEYNGRHYRVQPMHRFSSAVFRVGEENHDLY